MRFLPRAHTALVLAALLTVVPSTDAQQSRSGPTRPNIVLIFPDNLGWGEVGAYGSVRGVPTPNIDRIAAQGIRLDNFNVEFSCTVSRAGLLTGRYAIRSGATQPTGFTLWETTIAEALRAQGYATALYGKWHLGGFDWDKGRSPMDQGFDDWYGIPNTSNESQWMQAPELRRAPNDTSWIWEQQAGEAAHHVKVFDTDTRRLVDREAAQRGVAFIEKNARERRPFLLYYPMTQIHFPTLAHPDFAGKTGTGHIPRGQELDGIVHELDLFPTIAAAVGADLVPKDRPIDGVNQLP